MKLGNITKGCGIQRLVNLKCCASWGKTAMDRVGIFNFLVVSTHTYGCGEETIIRDSLSQRSNQASLR